MGRSHRHLQQVHDVLGPCVPGRLAYAVGYTGLGVGASRFGAESCSTFWTALTTSARG